MAETALMEAKKRGLASLCYSELGDISQRYHENLEWSKRIKRILNKEDSAQLVAYFQPIFNTRSGHIEKYETLARVVDAEQIISPAIFLDPAKQLGLLPKITLMMLEAIIVQLKQSDMEFSINITMQDLQQKDFCEQLLGCLHKHELPPSRIVLEILEDEEVYDYLDIFKGLKKEGFKLAIDDFGTGYSNFAKLQQIEVDYIKIDGSLIASIATNPRHLEVVRTINRYAHSIGAKTIAEFVSTEQIAQMLKHENIDYLQGYAIGKPDALLVTEKKV
jgi:EAL domain-containing protein (putative c-di-GMP-specific phosphodiesterase class I)